MTRTRTGAALLAASAALLACTSPEEKLIDRRHRLSETLDEIYEDYSAASGESGRPAGNGGVVGRFLAGVDRAAFDEYCLAVGRGERPFTFSSRLESFMKSKENARACRRAAELQLEVEKLEQEVEADTGTR